MKRKSTNTCSKFSRFYIKSPWFYFVDDEGGHWCQPDGLYINQNVALLSLSKLNTRIRVMLGGSLSVCISQL